MRYQFVGYDPGDRWCGWAILQVATGEQRSIYQARYGVADRSARSFSELVDKLAPPLRAEPMQRFAICESFQQRPVGHQRFAPAATPRLIGALHYKALKAGLLWREVPPGDPHTITKLILGDYFDFWMFDVHRPSDKRWDHARSAWRVIATFMMNEHTSMLWNMRTLVDQLRFKYTHPIIDADDLESPIIDWRHLHGAA
jgi:hypothetical protein